MFKKVNLPTHKLFETLIVLLRFYWAMEKSANTHTHTRKHCFFADVMLFYGVCIKNIQCLMTADADMLVRPLDEIRWMNFFCLNIKKKWKMLDDCIITNQSPSLPLIVNKRRTLPLNLRRYGKTSIWSHNAFPLHRLDFLLSHWDLELSWW